MWAWVAHRIAGQLIYVFLLVHVLDTALVLVSPEAYDTVIATYKNPVVGVAELGLVGAVLFHALNGLRVIAVDAWTTAARHHTALLAGVAAVWVALMIPFSVRHLTHVLAGA